MRGAGPWGGKGRAGMLLSEPMPKVDAMSPSLPRKVQPIPEDSLEQAVRAGLAELDAGLRIPLEDVEAWVASWGREHELPMPQAKRGPTAG